MLRGEPAWRSPDRPHAAVAQVAVRDLRDDSPIPGEAGYRPGRHRTERLDCDQGLWLSSPYLSALSQDFAFDLVQQTGFDGRGPAQPPQQACQAQHQFALDDSCASKPEVTDSSKVLYSAGSSKTGETVSAVSPCLTALRRERLFPALVFGPVLLSAFRRLASIWLNDAIRDRVLAWF